MDVRQIRYFVEIVHHGSFTRAAEQLHVAQPAISMAIRNLEEELDVTLFNRRDRKVSLTAEGEVFLEHGRGILTDLAAARQAMEDMRGLVKGEVRVGIPPMLSIYFFPDIICDFTRAYPNLRMSVSSEGASLIRRMISEGEIDMGVIAGSAPQDLEARHFLREEVVICVPPDHPFAARRTVTFTEFRGEPLIFYKEGYYLRELISGMRKETGEALNIVFETNLFSLVKTLIRRGIGISASLRMVADADPEVVAVPFDPPLHLDLKIAWKKNAYLSRANRAFVDFLLEQTKGYGATGKSGG
jgi:DNA-binding transcriptional LysR family regulator